jgi:hypothetical protein
LISCVVLAAALIRTVREGNWSTGVDARLEFGFDLVTVGAN